jgi:hypothetical protein
MRGFVKGLAGLIAAALWIWFYSRVQWWPGVPKPAIYVPVAIAVFFIVSWVVDKGYEMFTGVP